MCPSLKSINRNVLVRPKPDLTQQHACCYYWKGEDQDLVFSNCVSAYVSRALVIMIVMGQSPPQAQQLVPVSQTPRAFSSTLRARDSPRVKVGLAFTIVLNSHLMYFSEVGELLLWYFSSETFIFKHRLSKVFFGTSARSILRIFKCRAVLFL